MHLRIGAKDMQPIGRLCERVVVIMDGMIECAHGAVGARARANGGGLQSQYALAHRTGGMLGPMEAAVTHGLRSGL